MADELPDERPAGLIGAADNVLRLLALFERQKVIRVNEVSRDMGLSRSTVHRMLSTLNYLIVDRAGQAQNLGGSIGAVSAAIMMFSTTVAMNHLDVVQSSGAGIYASASVPTVKNSIAILVRVMEQAVRDGIIDRNPARVTGWQHEYRRAEDELDDPRSLAQCGPTQPAPGWSWHQPGSASSSRSVVEQVHEHSPAAGGPGRPVHRAILQEASPFQRGDRVVAL